MRDSHRAGRRALVRSTFDLAADFAQADVTGARRDFVQPLTRVDLRPRRLRHGEARRECRRRSPGGLRARARNRFAVDHDESTDLGLGRLPRRRARGDRDSRSLSRARDHHPNGGKKLSAPAAHWHDRRLRPWTVPRTQKTRSTRFPHRPPPYSYSNREQRRTSRLRASQDSDDTHTTYRVAGFQTFLTGRI
jgi:hypothetical protein